MELPYRSRPSMNILTLDQYWMGRDKQYPQELTAAIRADAAETVRRANLLLAEAGRTHATVNSGWRPPAVNAGVPGAAKKSNHMLGRAIDIGDDDGSLDAWCMAHLPVLERIGLWLEYPDSTPRWCHVQIVPPRSGNRVFRP